MEARIKTGILLNNTLIPAWQYTILERLKSSEYSDITVVIGRTSGPARERRNHGSFIFVIHQMIDRFIFSRDNHYAKSVDGTELLRGIPKIAVKPVDNGATEEFSDNDIDLILKFSPDLILNFGSGLITGRILDIPRFGIWSFTMDNYGAGPQGLTGYYEIANNIPVTCSGLEVIKNNPEENGVLASADESTCFYSGHLNRDRLFRRASLMIPRIIEGISIYGSSFLEQLERKNKSDGRGPALIARSPSVLKATGNLFSSKVRLLKQVLKKIFYSDPFSWTIHFRIGETDDFLNNNYKDFRKIKPSSDRFWADPFVITEGDRYYMFVEEYLYKRNKGHISVIELDMEGKLMGVEKVIEKPYHMSYPFVFRDREEWYMIPETGENRTIDLYRSDGFPGKWKFVKHLMTGVNAVDSTLLYYDNKWWLFTVIDTIECALENSPELYLYYSDDLLTDNWHSHPMNPVVSDVRKSRPAGRIFMKGGNIYRPGQDCSLRYGNAFSFNQITTLSETEYFEKEALKVFPSWDRSLKGTHTFNFDGDITVIDTYKFRHRSW